jgi:hypothetical protein
MITSGGSGSGGGSVSYSVAAHVALTPRSGTITIAESTFTVDQAAAVCSYSVMPSGASFGAGGGTGSASVAAADGCGWTAISNVPWTTITSGGSGSGNGVVNYSVAANAGPGSRSGTMTIAGSTFTVSQSAPAGGCGFSINPLSKSFAKPGGTGTISVTANPGCSWTAVSSAGWITIPTGGKGIGNGIVGYSVASNGSGAMRTGSITIAGIAFTVTQQP